MNYAIFFALYVFLGFAMFEVVRRLYAFLIRLAGQPDFPARRRIAARYYPIVALLVLAGLLSIVFYSITLIHRLSALVPITFFCAVLPSLIWWSKRIKTLRAFGYGAQGKMRSRSKNDFS